MQNHMVSFSRFKTLIRSSSNPTLWRSKTTNDVFVFFTCLSAANRSLYMGLHNPTNLHTSTYVRPTSTIRTRVHMDSTTKLLYTRTRLTTNTHSAILFVGWLVRSIGRVRRANLHTHTATYNWCCFCLRSGEYKSHGTQLFAS